MKASTWRRLDLPGLTSVTSGEYQSFARNHIIEAFKFTGANVNWIFGLESQMLRTDPKKTAL